MVCRSCNCCSRCSTVRCRRCCNVCARCSRRSSRRSMVSRRRVVCVCRNCCKRRCCLCTRSSRRCAPRAMGADGAARRTAGAKRAAGAAMRGALRCGVAMRGANPCPRGVACRIAGAGREIAGARAAAAGVDRAPPWRAAPLSWGCANAPVIGATAMPTINSVVARPKLKRYMVVLPGRPCVLNAEHAIWFTVAIFRWPCCVHFARRSFIMRSSDAALASRRHSAEMAPTRVARNGPALPAMSLGCLTMAGDHGPAGNGESIAVIFASLAPTHSRRSS